jgi:hypothetical protein
VDVRSVLSEIEEIRGIVTHESRGTVTAVTIRGGTIGGFPYLIVIAGALVSAHGRKLCGCNVQDLGFPTMKLL